MSSERHPTAAHAAAGASLAGRTALVTGSGQNIGRAIVLGLAARGANVVVCGRSHRGNVDAVVDEARALGAQAIGVLFDQGSADEVAAAVDETVRRFGSIDITVANAAIRPHQPFFSISVDDWQRVLNTNLSSAFYLARAAIPHMFERKWGRVIHISGRDGTTAMSDRAHNVTCKAGIHGLTKALAVEFGPHGITANTVSPGPTETTRNLDNYPDFENRRRYWLSNMPLGRLGRPGDVANACAFLASPDAEYVTGQLLHLSGGWVMS